MTDLNVGNDDTELEEWDLVKAYNEAEIFSNVSVTNGMIFSLKSLCHTSSPSHESAHSRNSSFSLTLPLLFRFATLFYYTYYRLLLNVIPIAATTPLFLSGKMSAYWMELFSLGIVARVVNRKISAGGQVVPNWNGN